MDQIPPKELRPPVNLRIKFRSETVEQFIERYAVDVSRGGIFIRTRDPLAVGTQLKLDFQFQGGTPLMSGDGTVVWIRELDPNRSNVPPGMGVRFDKLTPDSQAVLEQLLTEKSKRERGAVPGASTSATGMAVRRASSMFSALEPQVSVGDAATDKAPPKEPDKNLSGAPIEAGNQEITSPRATAPARPSLTTPPATDAVSASPKSISGLDALLGGRGKHPTPSGGGAAFDEGEEPTQIAGRLPSFLTSDEEATTVGLSLEGAEAASRASNKDAPLPGIGKVVELRPKSETAAGAAAGTAASRSPDGAPQPSTGETTRDVAKEILNAVAQASPSIPEAAKVAAEPKSAVPAPAAPSPRAVLRDDGASKGSKKRRPTAALIAGAVIVLGGAGIFVSRFFASQSTQTVPAGSLSAGAENATTGPSPGQPPTAAAEGQPGASGTAAQQPGAPATGTTPGATAGTPVAPSGAAPPSEPAVAAAPEAEHAAAAPEGAAAPMPSAPSASAASHKVVKKNKPAHAGRDSADDAATKAADANATARVAAANAKTANAKAAAASASPTTSTTTTGSTSASGSGTTTTKTTTTTASTTTKAPTTVASADSKAEAKADAKTAAEPAGAATGAAAGQASGSAGSTAADAAGTESSHEIRVTSKPVGADVALDGVSVGKTPYTGSIADVSAPHAIAVKKEGFEPFEQMISASSAWTKTKLPKGKPGPQVLKISAKLKQVGGGEGKSASEASASSAEGASKGEAARPDRPLPPSEEGSAKDTPP